MKRKLQKHVEQRLGDASSRRILATNATTKEYWFGKETAYREILAILKGEYHLR